MPASLAESCFAPINWLRLAGPRRADGRTPAPVQAIILPLSGTHFIAIAYIVGSGFQGSAPSRYQPSPPRYPDNIEEPWYDVEHAGARQRRDQMGRELVFLSEALIGEPIGIAETEPGDWLVRFAAAACVLSCPLPVLQPRHRRASAAP